MTIGRHIFAFAAAALALAGCTTHTAVNPSFTIDIPRATQEIDAMAVDPKPMQRPIVILAGWLDPGVSAVPIKNTLVRVAEDPRFISLTFEWGASFDQCRDKVIDAVATEWPSDDPQWTIEVDVIAISMGGIVARYAAAPLDSATRLRIARLFTIASPHQGAWLAPLPSVNQLQRDLRSDSDFMQKLNSPAEQREYPVYPYVRLGDGIVGEAYAAPDGQPAWWVSARFMMPSHYGSSWDTRILADISRRLRNESPYAAEPRAPLPY